ncbi:MAG: hypothetical protein Q9219_000414 [cf. Caloplaca sp. 3 TL-2023]
MARRGAPGPRKSSRSKRKSPREKEGLNAAYQELLAEAEVNALFTETGDEERPIKRRRIRGQIVGTRDEAAGLTQAKIPTISPNPLIEIPNRPTHTPQQISPDIGDDPSINSTPDQQSPGLQLAVKDESSEESDFAWEEVDLDRGADEADHESTDENDGGDLDLVLDGDGKNVREGTAPARRKPLTSAEKKLRLHIHKVHLLCLLSHVHLRNHWCNDQNVHKILYRRFSKETVSLLNPDENLPQFRQDESFKKGLEKVCQYFRNAFTVTARGMSRPYWADNPESIATQQPPNDIDLPILQKQDFLDCARKLEGSRDVGAQLFCALLRAAGVDTRLVCSLQVLPLTTTTKGTTSQKTPVKTIPVVDCTNSLLSTHNSQASTTRPRRLAQSPHPVFWLEAYNPHTYKQTPLSPLTSHSTTPFPKPHSLTPPLSSPSNTLTYTIAFSADLTAKDVTRRYTPSYTAKVLKTRVDSTPEGKAWLAAVLKLFQWRGSRAQSERDRRENEELARREASEGMPRNIADFKNHPLFALERHLRRNEIIPHPRKQVGTTATIAGGASEPVFRRKDVVACRSAGAWLRLFGLEIKEGEQPVKRLRPPLHHRGQRHHRQGSPGSAAEGKEKEEEEEEGGGLPLYAPSQTKPYTPPSLPPTGNPLPRQQHSSYPHDSLPIYHAHMIPPRAHHSTHPLTSVAAKILGIDAVDAVTGFTFASSSSGGGGRGKRRAKPVVTGAIIFAGHVDAVQAVLEGLEAEREEGEGEDEGGFFLREDEGEGGGEGVDMDTADDGDDDNGGGGFIPDADGEGMDIYNDNNKGGGGDFIPNDDEEEEEAGGFIPAKNLHDYDHGGGFVQEEEQEKEEKLLFSPSATKASSPSSSSIKLPTREEKEEGKGKEERLTAPAATENPSPPPPPPPTPRESRQRQQHPSSTIPTTPSSLTSEIPKRKGKEEQTENAPAQLAEEEGEEKEEVTLIEGMTLTPAELSEARMLQQLYERRRACLHSPPPPDPPHDGPLPESSNVENVGTEIKKGAAGAEEELEENKIAGKAETSGVDEETGKAEGEQEESSASEKGSLMSEDPDDEDAEPDWLV